MLHKMLIIFHPMNMKQILHLQYMTVLTTIYKKIGDSKFCITVDEAWDEFNREQITFFFLLIFVEKDGFIQKLLILWSYQC